MTRTLMLALLATASILALPACESTQDSANTSTIGIPPLNDADESMRIAALLDESAETVPGESVAAFVSGASAETANTANLQPLRKATDKIPTSKKSKGKQPEPKPLGKPDPVKPKPKVEPVIDDPMPRPFPDDPVIDPIRARWYHSVPREPMWLISAGNGTRSADDPNGLATWWHDDNPDAVQNFLEQIRNGYARGARRFFVNRPMGTNGATHVPAASWLTIPANKRSALVDALIDLNLSNDEEFHIFWFIGSDLKDPRSIQGWTPGADTFLLGETDTWEHLIASRNIIGGWMSTGASGLVIDHSSPVDEREHFMFMSRQLLQSPFEMIVMGEAFPYAVDGRGETLRDPDNNSPLLDMNAVEGMGWVGTYSYIQHESRWPTGTTNATWPPNPENTRMFCWFNSTKDLGTDADKRGIIELTIRDGLIPITNDAGMFTHALEIYKLMEGDQTKAPTTDRKLYICMPGTEEWNIDYINRLEAAGFPLDRTEYMLQIGARIHNLFPDEDILGSLNGKTIREYVAETAQIRLDRSWAPKPFTAWFYDYEPRHTDENGNESSWLWPRAKVGGPGFSKRDVAFLEEAYIGCQDVMGDLPGSVYGIPRTLGVGTPNPESVKHMKAFKGNTRSYGYAQLNLYPPNGTIDKREITDDNRQNHINRIIHGNEAMKDLTVDGTPIWAMMWPRFVTDNEVWFDLYMDTLEQTDIDTLIIWVNPHSATMSRVYADETIEGLPHILDWLNGE